MISSVDTLNKHRKESKCINTNIAVGLIVTSKVGYMEDKKKEEIIRSMRKEMMRCAQAVVGKKKFCIKLEDEHLGKIITSLLALILFEEDVDKGEKEVFLKHQKKKVDFLSFMMILFLNNVAYIGMLCVCNRPMAEIRFWHLLTPP